MGSDMTESIVTTNDHWKLGGQAHKVARPSGKVSNTNQAALRYGVAALATASGLAVDKSQFELHYNGTHHDVLCSLV